MLCWPEPEDKATGVGCRVPGGKSLKGLNDSAEIVYTGERETITQSDAKRGF